MNIAKNPLVRLGFLIVCMMVSIGLVKSIVGHFRRTDMVGERREALVKEQKRNQELKDRLKDATSEAFIEKQAREKLGMAKDGETIILMDTSRVQAGNSRDMEKGREVSHWKRWWGLFF